MVGGAAAPATGRGAMRAEDLILVSIDDHIVEPRDMFEGHVPAKWKDQAPKCEPGENGIETWRFQGSTATSVGLNAVVSWPKEEWGMEPSTFAEMRPGVGAGAHKPRGARADRFDRARAP